MNPLLQELHAYPFAKLRALLADIPCESTAPEISLAVGEPQALPPPFVLDELRAALDTVTQYPLVLGRSELRQAIADWLCRRYGLSQHAIDAEQMILPLQGTREGLFSIAQVVVDASQRTSSCAENNSAFNTNSSDSDNGDDSCSHEKPLVIMPSPFYQIYEGAAILAGAEPLYLPCDPDNGFLIDLDQVNDAQWRRCQLVYICNPSNPTGVFFSAEHYAKLLELADTFDFVVVSDECYSEIYSDETAPCPGLLQVCAMLGRNNYARCLVFNSLSKRSNLAGMRSGFVAGDPTLIKAYLLYRTYHGSAMPLHHQAASIVAWQDERHVVENRQAYREKLLAVHRVLSECLDVSLPPGGFCLWVKTPCSDEQFVSELYSKKNVIALPGRYLAREIHGINHGSGFIRLALVHSLATCNEAAQRIVEYVDSIR